MASNVQDAIMLLGDSITQGGWSHEGFARLLAERYARKLDVINRGYSGYQTDWAVPVFEQAKRPLLEDEQQHVPKVKLLTIWFGANDSCPSPPQHVPRDRYKDNLSHIIQMVKSPNSAYHSPETRIILITPPPVNTKQWNVTHKPRVFEITRTYAQAVKEVGEKENVSVVDIWTLIFDAAGRSEEGISKYTYDGLHLNGEGHKMVFQAIVDVVNRDYPELSPERMQNVFAPWDQVNAQELRSSLVKRNAQL